MEKKHQAGGREPRSKEGPRDVVAGLSQRVVDDNGWTFPLTDKEKAAVRAVVRAGYLKLSRYNFQGMKIDPVHVKTLRALFRDAAQRAWDSLPDEERIARTLGGQRRPRPWGLRRRGDVL
ncbi:MAG TPA: hypothetical protein VNE62_10905 [Actinomycetota bacterium]|nr:hypothetical protein [Actinomycetota bacterium]